MLRRWPRRQKKRRGGTGQPWMHPKGRLGGGEGDTGSGKGKKAGGMCTAEMKNVTARSQLGWKQGNSQGAPWDTGGDRKSSSEARGVCGAGEGGQGNTDRQTAVWHLRQQAGFTRATAFAGGARFPAGRGSKTVEDPCGSRLLGRLPGRMSRKTESLP